MRKVSTFTSVILLFAMTVTFVPCVYGQVLENANEPLGKISRNYTTEQTLSVHQIENERNQTPEWVSNAVKVSLEKLRKKTPENSFVGLNDYSSELALRSAEQDNLGMTHLRLDQIKEGVPVFGGQITIHINVEQNIRVLGRVFKDAETVETQPSINLLQAIEFAKMHLGYNGDFAKNPTAKLVILPHQIFTNETGATLTYLVELLVEDGTEKTARHFYFVDAKNGNIVWHYDNLQKQYGVTVGTGYSFYSGTVNFYTYRPFTVFYLQDNFKCPGCLPNPGPNPSYTMDMRNQTSVGSGYFFIDQNNIWGSTPAEYYQKAGVDAHFGMSRTWDYFYNVHGRYGIDGNGFQLIMRVHYDVNYINAFWNGNSANFGDGDGVNATPLVSVDTVAHEITHGLTEKTAGLIYAGESGGSNESFSDIFGTAVEFYTGINPDYKLGEDWFTPSTPSDALRYMG